MDDYQNEIKEYFRGGLVRMVCSNPVSSAEAYRRVVFVRKARGFQQESYTEKQVFHKNLLPDEAAEAATALFGTHMRQLNLTVSDGGETVSVEYKISKGGKVFTTKHKEAGKKATSARENGCASSGQDNTKAVAGQCDFSDDQLSHNRIKRYLIPEGTVIPALVDMGVFTAEGKVINSMQDKYRQINRFLEMVDDCYDELPKEGTLQVVDFGCGKSYLTFLVYYYFTEIKKRAVKITGLDLKQDVIATCNRAAERYGYDGLRFSVGDVSDYDCDEVDMVVTLHACDTATDYALYHAVKHHAKVILSVPCCQHELNKQIRSEDLSVFTNYGIIKERTAALLTDAIRADLLTANGYKTQVLEFIDLSHTPKNLLLRAVKCFRPPAVKKQALNEVKRAMEAFHVEPMLWKLLEEKDQTGEKAD